MRLRYLKQKTSSDKTNFYLDIIMLIGFLILMYPDLSGVAIHEWFSLVLGAVIAVHLILHWKWIVAVTVRFLKNLFHQSRLKYLLNLLLLATFMIVLLSGLMESQYVFGFFSLQPSRNPLWEWLHSQAANLLWFTVGLHLVLDWKWVVNAAKRYLIQPLRS